MQLSNCRVYEYQVGILIMVNVYYVDEYLRLSEPNLEVNFS